MCDSQNWNMYETGTQKYHQLPHQQSSYKLNNHQYQDLSKTSSLNYQTQRIPNSNGSSNLLSRSQSQSQLQFQLQ